MENKKQNNFKIGDILMSQWGYDQTNNSFYQVSKVSASYVYLLKVEPAIKDRRKTSQYDLDELRLYDVSCLKSCGEQAFKRKVLNFSRDLNPKDDFIKINSYEYARKFDEKEWVYCSWCA